MSSNLTFKDRAINFFERKWVKIITDFFNLRIIENHKFVWEAKGINVLAGITLGTLVLIIYIMIDIYKVNFGETLSSDNAVWGTFGDFFGGTLNPILAFVSFLAVIYTVAIQNKQFKTNEKTQAIQQFEGFFAYMAAELRDIFKGLDDETKNVQSYLDVGRDKFPLKNKLRTNFELVRFFMYLYQVLKHIHNLDDKFFEFEDKKRYSNIIRAGLSNEILQLIYLNCVDFGKPKIDDFQEYKKLITEFSFLEHMTFKVGNNQNYDYSLVYYSQFFNDKIFGDSYYFNEIVTGFYTNKIKSDFIYTSPVFLIQEIMPKEGLYFVDKITDDFRSIYISFEAEHEVRLYDCQERLPNSEQLFNSFTPFMIKRKGNDFFVASLHQNSITFKSYTSNDERRQLSLTFSISENRLSMTSKYSQFVGEVEHIYANGSLEKID